jgi:hypothetical protein
MDPSKKIVTRVPLDELWTDEGPVQAMRSGPLGEREIAVLLGDTRSTFVVASVGSPLRWVEARDRYDYWKKELKLRLVAPDAQNFRPEEFPGSYCYLASQWLMDDGSCLVLFEQHD